METSCGGGIHRRPVVYNDIGLYGLGLIMIRRFVNVRESGFLIPGRDPGSLCLWDPDFHLWNPESKFHWQRIRNPLPGIWNPCRGIQNRRLPYVGLVRCYSREHFAAVDPGGAHPLLFLIGQRPPQTTMVTEPYRLILIMFEKRSRKYMPPFIVVH